MPDYYFDTPSPVELSNRLQAAVELWKDRNKYIADVRDMIAGKNTIKAPASTQYVVRLGHTYALASIINEKASRFLSQPSIQVVPTTPDDRSKSTRLEKALQSAFFEMERHGDGDVWSRVIDDAIALDEGVELIEAAPAAFWPELVAEDEEGKPLHIMEGKDRDQYKKEHGLPVRTVYVPLEYYLPIYEGSTQVETFHLEQRSLRSVLTNPLFDTSGIATYSKGQEIDLKTQVLIVRYCNQSIYAYYAMTPSTSRSNWPVMRLDVNSSKGPLTLLRAYKHGRGKVIYNCIAGRFGGWKTNDTKIEPVGRALLDINQKMDELLSQAMTNVGARHWPNLKFHLDADRRGWTESGENPTPPRVQPGEPLLLYIGEDLSPTFIPGEDPLFAWTYDQLREQLNKLGGSGVLFGSREPGVDTGYHQALMISRAEHLDEKMEQHLVQGAINRATHIFDIVKSLGDKGERVWTHYIERDSGTNNKKLVWLNIDPEDLTPMPMMDARVRKTRPVDYIAAVRTANDATMERPGRGPLLSDDTVREEILAVESPDIEERKIRLQTEKGRLIDSGIITQAVSARLNLRLAQKQGPQLKDGQVAGVDPALLDAVQGLAGQQEGVPGGINPQLLDQVNRSTLGPGRRRGMVTTDSQPEARIGEEVAASANAGLGI